MFKSCLLSAMPVCILHSLRMLRVKSLSSFVAGFHGVYMIPSGECPPTWTDGENGQMELAPTSLGGEYEWSPPVDAAPGSVVGTRISFSEYANLATLFCIWWMIAHKWEGTNSQACRRGFVAAVPSNANACPARNLLAPKYGQRFMLTVLCWAIIHNLSPAVLAVLPSPWPLWRRTDPLHNDDLRSVPLAESACVTV